jgi:iron(III) transport system permease protein
MLFGGRFRHVFFGINLPLVFPAVCASGLIVFILTIEEFGTPEILGSRFGFEVIVTSIHEKFSDWPIDLPGASVLSVLLIGIAFCAYRLQGYIAKKFESRVDVQKMAGPTEWPSPRERLLSLSLFGTISAIAVLLPLISIATSSFMLTLTGGLAADNFGWQNFAEIFNAEGDAWGAISTSLALAFFAAIVTGVLGLIVSFTVVRLRMRGTEFLDFLSILPNSIPGMAIAVGLILTWNQAFWPITPYNTLAILLMAYLCLMLPYPIRMVTSALKQLPPSLDEAAYISGASEWTVIRRVIGPLLIPSSLAAAFIVFAISTRELVSSIMLAPPGVETVATYVFHQFGQGSVNTGMAMSLVTILLSGGIIVLARTFKKDDAA